jgi:hypothetical protein
VRTFLALLLLPSLCSAQFSQPSTIRSTSSATQVNSIIRDIYDNMGTRFSTGKAGLAPKSPGGTATFLRADGTWANPNPTPTPTPTPTVVYATLVTWLTAPDPIDDWIAGTITSDTLVDLSNDSVPVGATAVILTIGTYDAAANNNLFIGPSSRDLGDGDFVSVTAVSGSGDYRAKDRFVVQIGTDRKIKAKWSASNGIGTNACYVVGYHTNVAINQ